MTCVTKPKPEGWKHIITYSFQLWYEGYSKENDDLNSRKIALFGLKKFKLHKNLKKKNV